MFDILVKVGDVVKALLPRGAQNLDRGAPVPLNEPNVKDPVAHLDLRGAVAPKNAGIAACALNIGELDRLLEISVLRRTRDDDHSVAACRPLSLVVFCKAALANTSRYGAGEEHSSENTKSLRSKLLVEECNRSINELPPLTDSIVQSDVLNGLSLLHAYTSNRKEFDPNITPEEAKRALVQEGMLSAEAFKGSINDGLAALRVVNRMLFLQTGRPFALGEELDRGLFDVMSLTGSIKHQREIFVSNGKLTAITATLSALQPPVSGDEVIALEIKPVAKGSVVAADYHHTLRFGSVEDFDSSMLKIQTILAVSSIFNLSVRAAQSLTQRVFGKE